jgi:large conductance mechanosensitive channel
MLSEFKAYLTKSNALALAIGVILGTALGAVVASLVNDIIMPPIGYVLGGVDFESLRIVIAEATGGDPATEVAIRYGAFINAIIAFVLVAFVVFMIARALVKEAPPAPSQTCPYCRETVAIEATKCRYCGSQLGVPAVETIPA